MTARIDHIPNDIQGVMRLMTARKWEKAAIAYAFTKADSRQEAGARKGCPKLDNLSPSDMQFPCSISDFAALKVAGLSSRQSVTTYREAWQLAMKRRKAKAIKPGDPFVEPEMDWPGTEPAKPAPNVAVGKKIQDAIKGQNPTTVKKVLREELRKAEKAEVEISLAEEAVIDAADNVVDIFGGKKTPPGPKATKADETARTNQRRDKMKESNSVRGKQNAAITRCEDLASTLADVTKEIVDYNLSPTMKGRKDLASVVAQLEDAISVINVLLTEQETKAGS